jgi:hypothetical protein
MCIEDDSDPEQIQDNITPENMELNKVREEMMIANITISIWENQLKNRPFYRFGGHLKFYCFK